MKAVELEEELTEEQKAHIAVLRRKFFRGVTVFSIFFTLILLIILRFTVYNHKTVADYEQYVSHKDKFMRFNAAKALGSFDNDPAATRVLIKMLDDEAREVRWHAAASLSKLKDPAAVDKLIKILEKEDDPSAKSIYIYTLGQIRDDKAIPVLDNLLNSSQKNMTVNDNKVLKLSIIQALASYNNQKTTEILKSFEKKTGITSELKEFSLKMRALKGNIEN